MPRRGYAVEVVGAALLAAAEGAGHRRAAACVQAQVGTVRGWLRAVRAGAPALTACAVELAQAAGAGVFPPGPPARWAGRVLPEAVAALGAAARAVALHLSTPRPPDPGGPLTGVDYLAVIAERHRRYVHRRLRLADPGDALAALRGWPLINLITGGRVADLRAGRLIHNGGTGAQRAQISRHRVHHRRHPARPHRPTRQRVDHSAIVTTTP